MVAYMLAWDSPKAKIPLDIFSSKNIGDRSAYLMFGIDTFLKTAKLGEYVQLRFCSVLITFSSPTGLVTEQQFKLLEKYLGHSLTRFPVKHLTNSTLPTTSLLELTRFFIKNGADVNAQNRVDGYSILHYYVASRELDPNLLLELLALGININLQNTKGQTPLLLALSLGSYPIAIELLKMGADFTLCDKDGNSPLLSVAKAKYFLLRGTALTS